MPTNNYFHGSQTNLLQKDSPAINMPASSIIGLVGTAPGMVAGTYPLNQAILITDVRGALANIGTTGTLPTALAAIADQCSPMIIMVIVATPATSGITPEPTQDELTIGTYTGGQYTGMQALLTAAAVTGFRPKILGTPGLTSTAVTNALVVVAQQLRGFLYPLIDPAEQTVADVVTAAETFLAREMMPIWPETTVGNGDAEARAMGLRAAIDQATGWHKSLSNVPINNMDGLAYDVSWTLNDTASDAQALNDANVTTFINYNGFRFWGNHTTSSIAAYSFEVATRTSQALADAIEAASFQYADQPLTVSTIKAILQVVNAAFRKLVVQGKLIGATAWFDPTLNAADSLAGGQAVISYDFTPVAPLEGQTYNQSITDAYYVNFASSLASVTQTVASSS